MYDFSHTAGEIVALETKCSRTVLLVDETGVPGENFITQCIRYI
jgi:hypothetical protein